MSRRKKRLRAAHRQQRRESDSSAWEDVIRDTAACFTCSHQIAKDFVAQCDSRLEDLEADLAFNRVAYQMWVGRPGRAQDLAEALAAFIAAREREVEALTDLRQRFAALAADELFYEHLEPIERWRDFLRGKILPGLPPA